MNSYWATVKDVLPTLRPSSLPKSQPSRLGKFLCQIYLLFGVFHQFSIPNSLALSTTGHFGRFSGHDSLLLQTSNKSPPRGFRKFSATSSPEQQFMFRRHCKIFSRKQPLILVKPSVACTPFSLAGRSDLFYIAVELRSHPPSLNKNEYNINIKA